ncbi:isopentenyl-diphosphate Delta-isomerase [Thalassotalea litorea]|uniref:isopentenyl-diphosphate Delta-isomerase n=1 Tax=Thalassotalea litorea TaxID=2020715 RepID=UPI003735D606
MQQHVVLCDTKGRPTGLKEKLAAHIDGDLHLAFSVMIFRHTDDGVEFFLQRRALDKYHSGGLWTNTVCSHPRQNEAISAAALRRIGEELGTFSPLRFKAIGHIVYKARLDNGLTEHEYDHILVCECPVMEVTPNPEEVMDCRWWNETEIEQAVAQSNITFTAWFEKVFTKTRSSLTELAT